jgi:hypothetical protein
MRMPLWLSAVSRLAAVAAVTAGSVILVGSWRMVPPGDNPFIPLSLDHEVGVATPLKLSRALASPEACSAVLAASTSFRTEPIEDRSEAPTCGFENAVAIEQSVTPYSAPVQVSCPLAATLFLWEREVLQPLAEEHFGQQVARIDHYGSYSCRNIRGGRTDQPSEHATANAIDVSGFRLADGERVTVKDGWNADGEPSAFLHELHRRSCGLFRGVLGPEYNALHEDHFHLDMGRYSLCR